MFEKNKDIQVKPEEVVRQLMLDKHNDLIQKHDLDEIAFEKWAKEQKLSFWNI